MICISMFDRIGRALASREFDGVPICALDGFAMSSQRSAGDIAVLMRGGIPASMRPTAADRTARQARLRADRAMVETRAWLVRNR